MLTSRWRLAQSKAEVERWRKDSGQLQTIVNSKFLSLWVAAALEAAVFLFLMLLQHVLDSSPRQTLRSGEGACQDLGGLEQGEH